MSSLATVTERSAEETPRSLQRVRPETFLLAFSMFSTGFSGLVNEYVLATTATYILGNSIFQWSLIIAVMMVMMGIGGWCQKFLSDKGLIEKFALLETILALVGGFAPLANYLVFAYQWQWYQATSLSLVGLIGFMVGFEIPLVMRINQKYTDSLKTNAAWIFGLDYVGSFVGALVWIYFLLPNFPLTELSFLVSGANFAVALLTTVYFWRKGAVSQRLLLFSFMAVTALLLVFGFANNRSWSVSLEQKFYEEQVVHSETSRFQHIVLTRDNYTGNVELYLNGKKQLSSLDEQIYHEMLVHPVMALAPQAENVLILGGGDGLALREVLEYDSVKTITLVDLDPAMVELARTHPLMREMNEGAFDDARITVVTDSSASSEPLVREPIYMETGQFDPKTGEAETERVAWVDVLHIDAARYLDAVPGKFDVIIIDFPDPSTASLVKLYSKRVFARVRSRLSPNGLLAIQATSPYHAKDAYLSIGMTMQAAGIDAIPYHQNVPSFGHWGWYLGFRGSSRRAELVQERIGGLQLPVETDYITPELFRSSLVFPKGWLESERAGVNTLSDPVLLDLYLRHSWLIE